MKASFVNLASGHQVPVQPLLFTTNAKDTTHMCLLRTATVAVPLCQAETKYHFPVDVTCQE